MIGNTRRNYFEQTPIKLSTAHDKPLTLRTFYLRMAKEADRTSGALTEYSLCFTIAAIHEVTCKDIPLARVAGSYQENRPVGSRYKVQRSKRLHICSKINASTLRNSSFAISFGNHARNLACYIWRLANVSCRIFTIRGDGGFFKLCSPQRL